MLLHNFCHLNLIQVATLYRACGYDLDKDRDILGMLYVIEAEFGQLVQGPHTLG